MSDDKDGGYENLMQSFSGSKKFIVNFTVKEEHDFTQNKINTF